MLLQAIGLGLSVAQMVGGASKRTKSNRRLKGQIEDSLVGLTKRKSDIKLASETQREVAEGDYQENQKAEGLMLAQNKMNVTRQMEESNTDFARDKNKEGELSRAVESMDLSWEESQRRNTMQLDKVMASIDQFEQEEELAVEDEQKRLRNELEGVKASQGFFDNLWG